MKVYLVETTNEHSISNAYGIFDSLEKARQRVYDMMLETKQPKYNDCGIEIYEHDDLSISIEEFELND